VCFSHNPKISSPSFITLKPTSKSISQCAALQSTSPVLLFNQFLPKTSQAGQSIFQGIQDSLLFSPDLWIICIFFFNFSVFSSTNQACSHKLVPDSWFNFRVYFVLLIKVFSVLNYLHLDSRLVLKIIVIE
jgi:hypothetical protein